MRMRDERSGGAERIREAPHEEAPPVYRIASAAGEVLAEVGPDGGAPGRGTPTLVRVTPGVEVRPGHGGGLLLFKAGEPRGRTPADALDAGWVRLVQPSRRGRRRRPQALSREQLGALCRVFESWARPASERE